MDSISRAIISVISLLCLLLTFGAATRKSSKESNIEGLPLSPYELAMFTDLVLQISVLRCPLVSRPIMKSLKQYVFTTFSKAPGKGTAHPLFYSNYRSLVECLSYAEDKSSKSPGFHRRERRSLSEEFNSLIPQGEEGHERYRKEPSFDELFESLQNILEMTCPSNLSPNRPFLNASLKEAGGWIRIHEMSKQAHAKYFRNSGIIQQFENCGKQLLKEYIEH